MVLLFDNYLRPFSAYFYSEPNPWSIISYLCRHFITGIMIVFGVHPKQNVRYNGNG